MGGRTLNVAYAEPKGADQVPAQQVKVKCISKYGHSGLGFVAVSALCFTVPGLTLSKLHAVGLCGQPTFKRDGAQAEGVV